MRLITTAACAMAAGLLTTATAVAMPPPAKNFVGAPMSGANEVPPVETCGEGATIMKLRDGVLTYKVNVEDLDEIVAAHLHYGFPGENGPILVTLFEMEMDDDNGDDNGGDTPSSLYDDDDDDYPDDDDDYPDDDEDTLAFGSISDDDVDNPGDITFEDGTMFEGTVDGLVRLLREGAIYVNVHTVANPSGEIRAQLRGNGTGGPNPNRGNGDLCDDDDKDCDDYCCCKCDCDDDPATDDCDCDDDDANGDDDCCDCCCKCDDDHDGDVDCDDARRGDLNGDGVVDEKDLRILLDNFTNDDDDADDDDDDDDNDRRRGRRGMMRYGG